MVKMENMKKMKFLFTITCQLSKSHTHLDGKPRGTEEKGRRKRERGAGMMNELN